VVALSDLLLLEPSGEAASDPGVLEDHLERVLPPGPVEAGPVELAWEMQGVQGTEGPLTLRLAAAPAGRGLLRRIGELLSLVDPSEGVTLSWTEEPPEAETPSSSDPVFRRTELDLSHLPPGPVHITLELELPGRTEVRSEIVVDLDPPTRSP
jgi:hypothetical protein